MTGPRPARRWPTLVLTLVFLLVAAGVLGYRGGLLDDLFPSGPGCDSRTPVTVASSSEKSELLRKLAATYNTTDRSGGDCALVDVTTVNSGEAATALGRGWDGTYGKRPDVWSPAATTWIPVARNAGPAGDVVPTSGRSLSRTPLVIGMPRPMAEALGWPDKPIGWRDLLALSGNPAGWGSVGHPEWGRFTFGKTNPQVSTSGLHAMLSAYNAAGGSGDLTTSKINSRDGVDLERALESVVVHYSPTELTFLRNFYDADRTKKALGYISAVAIEEKAVLDYNQGNPTGDPDLLGRNPKPTVPLVAFPPSEGTMVSDSPYLVLDALWVDSAKRAAADDFGDWLLEDSQQAAFQAAGFRNADGVPGPAITPQNGLLPAAPSTLPDPPADVVARALSSWPEVRRRANVTLVVDRSGSMNKPVEGTGQNRLQQAGVAVSEALQRLVPSDDVGLWTFSTAPPGGLPYRVDVGRDPVASTGDEIRRALTSAQPLGGTALYQTTRAAVADLQANYDPGRINAVVVLTDGRNEDTPETDPNALLAQLRASAASQKPVRVFSIAYGGEADGEVLDRIARESGGQSYGAQDPQTIEKVLSDVFANF